MGWLRDHTDIAIDDDLWRRLSTEKPAASTATVTTIVNARFLLPSGDSGSGSGGGKPCAGDGGMESEAVLPDPKNLLLVLDEGITCQMWRGMRWR